MITIPYLLANSNLPGPRGNLELMYTFARTADKSASDACLEYITPTVLNSPEEYAGMCGIVSFCVLNRTEITKSVEKIRPYASHASWRIREAVAMGIQEMAVGQEMKVFSAVEAWTGGNELEQRAFVAAFCEPKLLKDPVVVGRLLSNLENITDLFRPVKGQLSDTQNSLRKTLGYGWSVAIAADPEQGLPLFEKLKTHTDKHTLWIVRENLKKNRLIHVYKDWFEKADKSR